MNEELTEASSHVAESQLIIKQSLSRISFLEEQIALLQRELEAKTHIQEVVTAKMREERAVIENGMSWIPGLAIR